MENFDCDLQKNAKKTKGKNLNEENEIFEIARKHVESGYDSDLKYKDLDFRD